jgi:hypothetical protein
MKTARTIGLGLVLILVGRIGAATLSRAQQAGEKSSPPTPSRAELRDEILKLRTEVDVLQAEYDGARANLLKSLELVGASELTIFDMVAAGAMEIGSKKDGEASAILENFRAKGAEQLKGMDTARLSKSVAALARGDKGAATDVLQSLRGFQNPYADLVELHKLEFAGLSKEVRRKQFDLSEAEKQYQTAAR